MYCRYTSMSFDPADRVTVKQFWDEVGGPVVAIEEGFQGGLVMESVDAPGVMRAVTIWRDSDDFNSFSASLRHAPVIEGIRATSMSTTERDGMNVMLFVEPVASEIRIIRCQVAEGQVESLRNFWHLEGRALVENAPGCIKADALIDEGNLQALIVFHWRTVEAAEAFRNSDIHNEQFVPAIERFVTPIEKLQTRVL